MVVYSEPGVCGVPILSVMLTSCVTLEKFLNLPEV